jgi:HAD superfamily hydrolase (TIGR01490 family)
MALAIFDLDNTLLNGDSDDGWAEFLASKGMIDGDNYQKTMDRFIQEQDDVAYLNFSLSTTIVVDERELEALLEQFVAEIITPMVTEKSLALIKKHRDQNNTLLIITATNEIITRPIARLLEIEHLIATQAERIEGRLSGRITGIPSYAEGKVGRLKQWLSLHNKLSLEGSFFYSDSDSDIPLLEIVDYPHAVNANEKLTAYARAKNWPCISLR